MGCDIHVYAEARKGDRWRHVLLYTDIPRNYALFGWLAGVRATHIEQAFPVRGFPEDACEYTRDEYEDMGSDAHTASWVTTSELLGYDYSTTTRYGIALDEVFGADWFRFLEEIRHNGSERIIFWFDS